MVGETAVIAAALERVPAGVPARALIQVEGPDDELELTSPGDLEVTGSTRPPASPRR